MILNTTFPVTKDQQLELIADGLANEGYVFVDGFFSPEEVTILANGIHSLDSKGDLRPAGIGAKDNFQTKSAIRGDEIKWLRQGQSIAGDLFLNRMDVLVAFLNRTCYLGIRDSEFHLAKYPIGSFYKRHSDNFQQSSNRRISVVCYLNENWGIHDGGELRLFLPQKDGTEKSVDIAPIAGRIACFLSHIEHEVLPAIRERLSATGWLLQERKLF